MPRPRKASDDEVFAAAYRAMTRLGPGELTLAEIAAEAGLTAGALVQRFGSKRELLLRLSAGAVDGNAAFIRGLRAKHRSPLAVLRAYAECLADLAASPAALARNLAYLQIDLTDPDFRKHLVAQAKTTRAAIVELLESAIASGELSRDADARGLARAVETALSGSLLTWAMYRDGGAARWLRDDVDAVLAPYLTKRRRR
ncbi:MAG TPA: helix-turn-helix domain-containing protein [Gemmatimonadaceae bacterium]